jgi:hypothetical protein
VWTRNGLTRRQAAVSRRLLWIFGSPRSGSTWLLKMLDDLPGVTGVNEPFIGRHLAPFASDLPGMRATDFDVSTCTFNRLAGGGDGYFFAERHTDAWVRPLGQLICERFAVRKNVDVIAIQEPNGSQGADMILRAVPQSRLLFLLRDGRDVVDSELAAYGTGGWMSRRYGITGVPAEDRRRFLEDAAWKWVWRTSIVKDAHERHPGPKLMVRYEELRPNAQSEMARIVGWLGLDADVTEVVERHDFGRVDERGPSEFARAATPGGWRENLSDDEQQLLEAIMGDTLRAFDY